ncbi:Broad specificity phosphatase PhoE [Marininema mesophilum]|uniref:Broad specificity phosphatase PhoE n=1 Tax=Marininema mesophilum TaxID=1048340 RepID=A0A1H2YM76_9BACL|nr:histidine phosphatase family protein [Marininema mesophilum]SDX06276.1 Broad specificity phosphatase PhoE [Marininema mesophilum]
MTQFYLVRHGEPYWELTDERQLIGVQRDLVPLSTKGEREAKQVAYDPRFAKADLIITSPYTRALQTASIISRILDLPIQVEYDLHEWIPDQTLSYDSFEKLKELRADFRRHKGIHPPDEYPVWETMESIIHRVQHVLERYRDRQRVIVICHGTVIRAITGAEDELDHCGIQEWEL